jgi:hypothetical protein
MGMDIILSDFLKFYGGCYEKDFYGNGWVACF